jgi:hypothetical protein
MKTKLITALRTAAKALEDNTFAYDWTFPQSCNCGVVVGSLLGKSITELKDDLELRHYSLPKKDGKCNPTWHRFVQHFCPVTGIPKDEILKELFNAGMTAKDISELEYLSNPEVRKRMKPRFTTEYEYSYEIVTKEVEMEVPVKRTFMEILRGSKPATEKKIKKISNRIEIKNPVRKQCSVEYTNKQDAIEYMRAWADMLVEEGKDDVVKENKQEEPTFA